jgi:hypothetical protein
MSNYVQYQHIVHGEKKMLNELCAVFYFMRVLSC